MCLLHFLPRAEHWILPPIIGVMRNDLLILLAMAIGYLALLIIIEYAPSRSVIMRCGKKQTNVLERNALDDPTVVLDDDVRNEAVRVQGLLQTADHQKEGDKVLIANLHKFYGEIHAVKGVNLGVKQGEVFGYLGVNGAGKTTTMSCLTGDVTVSLGTAFVNGIPITKQSALRRFIGFCPQFDALFDQLTAREHLKFYGRIKGLKGTELRHQVVMLLDVLSLNQYADRKAGTYSGGNKRKLSVAIAMIGNPPIVFLDEISFKFYFCLFFKIRFGFDWLALISFFVFLIGCILSAVMWHGPNGSPFNVGLYQGDDERSVCDVDDSLNGGM